MQQGLFRQVALERLSSPDQLDRLMRVTDPKTWIALAALAVLTVAVVAWAAFGDVAITARAQGVIIREGGTYQISAHVPGHIESVSVRVGDLLEAGQVIATVESQGSTAPRVITSPFPSPARVLEILVAKEDAITADTTIVSVELLDEEILGVFYLPATVAGQVRPGMAVRVSPSSAKREEFGFMIGRVRSVAPFPSTERGMTALLENDSLVQLFRTATRGAPVEARVELIRGQTPSGFRWSSSSGPPVPVASGTLALADFVLSDQSPISQVLPAAQ